MKKISQIKKSSSQSQISNKTESQKVPYRVNYSKYNKIFKSLLNLIVKIPI